MKMNNYPLLYKMTFFFLFTFLMTIGVSKTGAQTMVLQDKQLPFPFVVFPGENQPSLFFADSLTTSHASGLPLFNLDQYYVYGYPTNNDSVFRQICRQKSFTALENFFVPGNFNQQKVKVPPYAGLFKKEFYRVRRILPRMILFCPDNFHKETKQSQRIVEIPADTLHKPGVFLIESEHEHYDEIYFRFRESTYRNWSAAEYIISQRVIYNFLNKSLIYKKHLYNMGSPPEIRLTSIQYPHYMPDIQLQVDTRYAKQIILSWESIYRKLKIYPDERQFMQARDEVRDNIFLNSQSPRHRITLTLKAALYCGNLLNMESFLREIEKIDLADLEDRLKNLLEWQQFDIYWVTTQTIDSDLIRDIKDFTGMKYP